MLALGSGRLLRLPCDASGVRRAVGKIRGAVSLPFNFALEARTVAQQLKDREAWYILYADASSPDKCGPCTCQCALPALAQKLFCDWRLPGSRPAGRC